MKIKSRGWAHDDWKGEYQCQGCGTIWEVERGDLFFFKKHDIRGKRLSVLAQCGIPTCRKSVIIADGDRLSEKFGSLPHKEYQDLLPPEREEGRDG